MSIWGDIKKSGIVKQSKPLTKTDLTDLFKNLGMQAPEREFVVQTGVGGMKMLQDAMQTEVYLKLMKDLNFSREERKRLGEMIKSPDPENFQIVKILIDNKLAETKEIREYGNSKK